MKDRLIELYEKARDEYEKTNKAQFMKSFICDYLYDNEVFAPPYKIGQTVYVLRSRTSNGKNLYLRAERIDHYCVFGKDKVMCFESVRMGVPNQLWETRVFPTIEQAEAKLKEGGEG